MYVVVYLIDAQKHIVVPKQFILGLSQEYLDNYGKNRNIAFRIFYSKRVSATGLMPNEDFAPDFTLNVSKIYPPDEDETCYIAHLKYFFSKCLVL